MKSARGIYYDLKESDYVVILNVNNKEIRLFFSSLFIRKKFIENIYEYIKNQNMKLSSMYKLNIDLTEMLLLSYYKKIEKRGFRVLINNKEIDSNLKLTII